MILDNFFKNLIYEPVSVLGLLVFYFLLINLPISLGAVFKKKSSAAVRLITILVNLLITLQLLFRCPEIDHLKSNCNVINKFTKIVISLTAEEDFFLKTAPKEIGKLINKK